MSRRHNEHLEHENFKNISTSTCSQHQVHIITLTELRNKPGSFQHTARKPKYSSDPIPLVFEPPSHWERLHTNMFWPEIVSSSCFPTWRACPRSNRPDAYIMPLNLRASKRCSPSSCTRKLPCSACTGTERRNFSG